MASEEYRGCLIYTDHTGDEWRWRRADHNHRIIADGSEGYVTKTGVKRAVDNVIAEFADEADRPIADEGGHPDPRTLPSDDPRRIAAEAIDAARRNQE